MNLSPNQTLVISLSGGKDSTATALHLLESGVIDRHVQAGGEVRRVFLDTGWELDETYQYLDEVLTPRLGRIDRAALWVPGPGEATPQGYDHLEPLWATPGKTMAADRWALAQVFEARMGRYSPMIRYIMHIASPPTKADRWCTAKLKQKPALGVLRSVDEPVNIVGLRAEESPARAALPLTNFDEAWDCWIWRPILRWSREDVIAIHQRHGLAPNPLYLQGAGAGRVGCGPCVHTGRQDMRWLLDQHPERLALLADMEAVIEGIEDAAWARSAGNYREAGQAPTWFNLHSDGERVHTPVSRFAAWALSEPRKGGQVAMFPNHEPPGCSIWGLCEVPREKD